MATKASEDKDIIYFPIDQGEQAKQAKPEYLLARPVYERIAGFLKESVNQTNESFSKDKQNIEKKDDLPDSDEAILDLDEHRAHNAILLDGGRGTGKSTILVNLPTFMKDELVEINSSESNNLEILPLSEVLLILKPVDPTLLENDDDLFLNIIVAALLRNEDVKKATKDYKKSKAFYERLQALGSALEGAQKQKSEFGMDKLRAFIGNHSVSDEVHKLFYEALKITSKKLIVLPIDDVDTSLQHAFNNLEVVRRYLASPYVVPIISGDLDLFHEVIWRNFFEGITAKGRTVEVDEAKLRAKNLADEYERKLLPVVRRNSVQSLSQYIANQKIYLSADGKALSISLGNWYYYINRIHNHALNNFENSWIYFSFSSIRSFSQLTMAVKDLIMDLDEIFVGNVNDGNTPPVFLFERLRFDKNKEFLKVERNLILRIIEILSIGDYQKDLLLVYLAEKDWYEFNQMLAEPFVSEFSVFGTPLFLPLVQSEQLKDGCVVDGLKVKWQEHLHGVISDAFWLDGLPEKTILSYPLPDKGVPIRNSFELKTERHAFVNKLFEHGQLYLSGGRGSFIFFGRLFEILVLSLFENVNEAGLSLIFHRAPFYSLVDFSGTKAINFPKLYEGKESKSYFLKYRDRQDFGNLIFIENFENVMSDFSREVEAWRRSKEFDFPDFPNSLLIYRVMNKFFTQLANFEKELNSSFSVNSNEDIAEIGLKAFNAFCAAIGSFQESNLSNISSESGFECESQEFEKTNLYASNIGDFKSEGKPSSVTSYAKAIFHKHPLRQWLLEAKNNS